MAEILERILEQKSREVQERKELYPLRLLERSRYFETEIVSLKSYLARPDKVGVIAEIKRKSPSKGVINDQVSIEELSTGYMQAGASALSVLTDSMFFGGSNDDLTTARRFNFCPILRKDFIIDEYQLVEARSIGADVVLLIAKALKPPRQRELARAARQLGLEVLLEVHSEAELQQAPLEEVDFIGVNNRSLDTFSVDLNLSFALAQKIPAGIVKIAESGISSAESIRRLKAVGFSGFLIGGAFMQFARPEAACAKLVRDLLN